VAIAKAVAMKPDLIVFDEATSALDVKTQAQIIKLLLALRDKINFSAIFVSHNIALVQKITGRMYVMRDARVVEEFKSNALTSRSRDPYTKLLIESAQI